MFDYSIEPQIKKEDKKSLKNPEPFIKKSGVIEEEINQEKTNTLSLNDAVLREEDNRDTENKEEV